MITIHTPGSPRLAAASDLQAVVAALSDDQANALIDQASAMIAAHCQRVFHSQDVTEIWRDVSTAGLVLSRYPVASITAVTVDDEVLASADYELDQGFLYRLQDDRRTCWRGQKVTVEYTGGYAANAIPADLKRACVDLCVNLNATSGRDMTERSVNIPDVRSVSYRDPKNGGGLIPSHVMSILGTYREWRL